MRNIASQTTILAKMKLRQARHPLTVLYGSRAGTGWA